MREREFCDRDRDRDINVREKHPSVASLYNQTCNLGMCPNWDLNLHPFGESDNAPTSELLTRAMLHSLRCR